LVGNINQIKTANRVCKIVRVLIDVVSKLRAINNTDGDTLGKDLNKKISVFI